MSKKPEKSDEAKTLKPQSEKTSDKTKKSEPEPEESKPHDYGGLPQRDLKKNLGCS